MQLKITTFAIALTLISALSMANAPSNIKIVPASGNVFTLYYAAAPTGLVKVSIVDSRNKILFTENILKTNAFTRPYNFSELSPGEYKIIVEDKSGRQEQIVKYGINETKTYIKIAEMSKEESKFLLSIGSTTSQTVIVRIYDNANGLVHEQEMEVSGNYGLIFNLSKVRSSNKSIVMFEVSTSAGEVQTAMF